MKADKQTVINNIKDNLSVLSSMAPDNETDLINLFNLQEKHREWSNKNFGDQPPWTVLLGIQEEVGELSHHFLKQHQGIRKNKDHVEGMKDSIGDIFIYALDFCSRMGFNAHEILINTLEHVHSRDWTKEKLVGKIAKITKSGYIYNNYYGKILRVVEKDKLEMYLGINYSKVIVDSKDISDIRDDVPHLFDENFFDLPEEMK